MSVGLVETSTKYSLGAGMAPVKLPCMLPEVISGKLMAVGCAVGVLQVPEVVAVTVKLSILIFGLEPLVPPVPL